MIKIKWHETERMDGGIMSSLNLPNLAIIIKDTGLEENQTETLIHYKNNASRCYPRSNMHLKQLQDEALWMVLEEKDIEVDKFTKREIIRQWSFD